MDASGSVYGTILASSILATLSYREVGNAWVMIGALLATEGVFAAAHALSTVLGAGRLRGRLPGPAEARRALELEWPVIQAAWPAIILLTLSAFGLLSVDTAVNLVLAGNSLVLFVWGFALARQQDIGRRGALSVGALSCALGVAIVALKLALH